MPDDFAERFRTAQERVAQARRERDQLILEALETASLREVGKALGISHTMVAKYRKQAE